MAIPTRVIKRRIKSIRSTGKIMKAMELVAASKMRKATQLTLATRPYSKLIQDMAHDLRKLVDPKRYSLLVGKKAPPKNKPLKILLVVLASDRGLCGGFNNQLLKKSLEFVRQREGQKVRMVAVGRRAESTIRRSGNELVASFESIANAPSFERVKPVASLISEEFLSGTSDRIFVAFTDYRSALSQVPSVHQLLPIVPEAELPKDVNADEQETSDEDEITRYALPVSRYADESVILFEPGSDAVMRKILPRMVEMQLYQAFLESAASEQSARMMAMRSAGDAAGEMLDNLTFTLNQARQAAITREISEISAGKAALE